MDDDLLVANLRGFEIKLKTKSGVFSKSGIDVGSKLLIDNMEVTDGTLVADLGCGTGIVGFVASKLNYNGHVHLLDDHLRSIELAAENVDLNNLKNVEVFLSDLFSAVRERTYHLILSNPPQHLGNEFLEDCAKQCFDHLKSKGVVFWVVQNHLKPVIERIFDQTFKNYKVVAHGKDHVVLSAKRD